MKLFPAVFSLLVSTILTTGGCLLLLLLSPLLAAIFILGFAGYAMWHTLTDALRGVAE